MLCGVNPNFSGLSRSKRQIVYALRTRAPVSREQAPSTPRLACVRPAASVHPEPGSNSSSLIFVSYMPWAVRRGPYAFLTTNRNFQYSKWLVLFVDLRRFRLDLTLSIQYVYELVSFFTQLVSLLSGCKYKTLFLTPQ